MSSPSLHSESNSFDEQDTVRTRLLDVVERASSTALVQLRAAGFWTAIALPFLYVPILAYGLEEQHHLLAFLGLLALNLVALFLGRGHTPN